MVLLFALPASADPIAKAREAYEDGIREIEKAGLAKKEKIDKAYVYNLRKMIVHMNKIGDEFGVRPAEAEIKRHEPQLRVTAVVRTVVQENITIRQVGWPCRRA